jgi:PAS domain S-box-containing protein
VITDTKLEKQFPKSHIEPSRPVGRILVVDDEPELRSVLVESLRKHGYEAIGCASGRAAIDELNNHDFDLLLTDLMMPEMDGIALLKVALEIDPDLVCIVVTGQGTIQSAVDAMQIGAFDYVLKPFHLQSLMPILTRALNTRQLRLENLQLRETVAIHELSQTISFTLDPHTVMSKLTEAALKQTDADEVSVLLPTNDGKEFYVAAARGARTELLLGERIPFDRSIASWVARERTPLILNGEVKDDRFVALWPRPAIRSSVSVPMLVANKLIGVLNLNVTSRSRPFALGQMKALSILASVAAAALESASLYSQLRTTEEKYRTIFENATEGLFQTSLEGRILTANPALARIFGYDSAEEMVRTVTDIEHQLYLSPDDRTRVTRLQAELGTLTGFEIQNYRKDREKIWISLNQRSVKNQIGEVIYFEGSVSDITDRKAAEEERAQLTADIEAQRQRLDNIITSVPGIVWEAWGEPATEGQHINFVSDYVESMLGYTADEWISTPDFWPKVVHPEDRAEAERTAAEAFASGKSSSAEFRLVAKDGREVWVESKSVVVVDDLGNPIGTRGVTTNIGERKAAEAALKQSESDLAAAQRQAQIGSWNLNLLDNSLTWSDEHYRIFGVKRSDFKVRYDDTVFNLIHPEDRELVRQKMTNSIEKGQPFDFLFRVVGDSGQERIIHSRAQVESDAQGKPFRLFGTAQDVSERERIAEEQRKAQRQYESLVHTIDGIVWEMDALTFAFTFVSNQCERILGYTSEQWLSDSDFWLNHVHPDDREWAGDFCRQQTERRADHEFDYRMIAADGRVVWLRDIVTVDKSQTGGPRLRGVMVDITERKLAEDQLKKSEERYRELVENAHDLIYEQDLQGNYLSANKEVQQITGYSLEESLQLNLKDIIAPEYLERAREMIRRKLAGERVTAYEIEIIAKDGHRVIVEVNSSLIQRDGVPVGIRGIARDITNRKEAESRLAAQYAVTGALAESSTVSEGAVKSLRMVGETLGWEFGVLWAAEPEQEVLRCIQVWNGLGAAANELEEISRDLAIQPGIGLPGIVWKEGQPLWIGEVGSDETQPRSMLAAAAGFKTACAFPIQLRSQVLGTVEFFSRSRRKFDPALLAMMVTIGSQIGQFIETKRVEQALQMSEEQLRQSQKLEAIGQLAGGVAHDFNNLLTVIGGYSSILLNKLDQTSPLRGNVEEIKKASDRAGGLTRQLLAFSRKQILEPKILDLNVVVSDLDKMLRRLIGEDIDLLTITDPKLAKVKADPGQIEQVLLNLIVNGRDAMPNGGKLTIETANATLSGDYALSHAALSGAYVMLAVSDTGCGMDAELQKHVFEPFFTTKLPGKGTGLGLATVYGIVKQSEGHIWLYSEPNKGTSFKIYLPCVGEEAMRATGGNPGLESKGTETLLLVEDEDQVRRIVKAILEQQGYDVLTASNGEEALKIAEQHGRRIHMLMTDVVMPLMSGRQLAEALTSIRPDLKVLYMSGYTDDAIVRHGLLDASLSFIQKPFDAATAARKVRQVLDSEAK